VHDGRKPQLTKHQCDVVHKDKDFHHAVFPYPHAPIPLRVAKHDAIQQKEVASHDDPFDQPVGLVITPHVKPLIQFACKVTH
jgi:hypothetical protein